MKFKCLSAIFLMIGLSACLNNDDNPTISFDPIAQFNEDQMEIEEYLAANNIDATFDSLTAVYYLIENEGTGANPTVNSSVEVKYKGYFLNGDVFDQSPPDTTVSFPLSGVILGWQLGIPLFQKGGSGKLFLVSGLAYGPSGQGPIPPNTPIVFDVELVDFQ